MEINTIARISTYKTSDGKKVFDAWLKSLDSVDIYRITARLDRLEAGNLGNWKRINGNLYELKLSFGPGYRIYFCTIENEILLLWGETKNSQLRDIRKAMYYFDDFKERLK